MKNNRNKKIGIAVLSAALSFSLCGCGGTSSDAARGVTTESAVNSVIAEQMAKEQSETETTTEATTEATTEKTTETTEEKTTTEKATTEATTETAAAASDVDIDMTKMNSDMIYSTVYQMMSYPEDYIGKRIRVDGTYVPVWYDLTGQYYHYCLIADAIGCCQQGLEFVWDGGIHSYPDDYPAEDTPIVVTGTFETYKDSPEDPATYCRLSDADMEIEDSAEAIE